MNVKRFTGRTSRDALNLVKQAFGDDAVVLSTRPCAEGVEVLAMAGDGMQQIEALAQTAPKVSAPRPAAAPAPTAAPAEAPMLPAPAARPAAAPAPAPAAQSMLSRVLAARAGASKRVEPQFDAGPAFADTQSPEHDAEQLEMSTLSFQDYVRDRMLKRREAELGAVAQPAPAPAAKPVARQTPPVLRDEIRVPQPVPQPVSQRAAAAAAAPATPSLAAVAVQREEADREAAREAERQARREQAEMMSELRSMKGLIEQRFGALAFMEKLQRSPAQATLSQKLLEGGFSPALIRKLTESLPADATDPQAWAANVLERNLHAAEQEPAVEDVAGVFALIGSTGVGKTTTTAKIAAAFATRHGASSLGLITLDAYRVAAHEQLRTYGRILGVPVHTAHDRASLEDLLDLLSAKKMVLIDTAGMAQRDTRTRELLEMVSHRSIQKLLVINAAAQGETIEDVIVAWRAAACRGVVLSKIDEAVKLGPALDALIRHKLRLLGVANGQRVPEDWHRLSAQALVQRALRATAGPAYQLDASDVNLVFAGLHAAQTNAARQQGTQA